MLNIYRVDNEKRLNEYLTLENKATSILSSVFQRLSLKFVLYLIG